MALMTGEQYIESIRKIPMEIYMFGKKVENPVDNPILRPSLNSVRMTYDLAQMPEYQELMTAISPETGERINRFTHIHRSTEDLRNKVKMQRLLGQKTAACFQRCVGMDALNAVFSTTYEIDARHGHRIPPAFRGIVKEWQEKDWTVDGAMTDPKGNRGLAPHAQKGSRHVPARGGTPRGRHRGARRQDAPDRRPQLPSDPRHAHADHARGRPGLCRGLLRPRR